MCWARFGWHHGYTTQPAKPFSEIMEKAKAGWSHEAHELHAAACDYFDTTQAKVD